MLQSWQKRSVASGNCSLQKPLLTIALDHFNPPTVYLQVKFLSVLRVLGRGICFDELYDGSGLSESVTSRFFHRFVAIFADRFFKNNSSNIENALDNKLCALALLFALFVTFDHVPLSQAVSQSGYPAKNRSGTRRIDPNLR